MTLLKEMNGPNKFPVKYVEVKLKNAVDVSFSKLKDGYNMTTDNVGRQKHYSDIV